MTSLSFLRSRPVRWLRWCAGVDTKSKVVALCFTVAVSMILRNELVILIAQAGWGQWWTHAAVYTVGFVTYVLGSHANAFIFSKKEWR